jgi:hypothetical protein
MHRDFWILRAEIGNLALNSVYLPGAHIPASCEAGIDGGGGEKKMTQSKWAICEFPGCTQKGARQKAKQVCKAPWSNVPVCTGCRRDRNRKQNQDTLSANNSQAGQEGGAGKAPPEENMLRGFLCKTPLQGRLPSRIMPAYYCLGFFFSLLKSCNFLM